MTTLFTDFLNNTPFVLLGGAMGTELQRRGYATTLPLWSASANLADPNLVLQIHRDYFAAGADLCITNTFRTTPRAYAKVNKTQEAHAALKAAVNLAKTAAGEVKNRNVFIGGSFAPLEDCYEPDLVPPDSELESEHALSAKWLAAEGVDFLMPETINALREAKFMAKAASDTGLPFIISFVVDANTKLLDGTTLDQAIKETDLPGRVAVSINCRPIDILDAAFKKQPGINCVYPNGFGHPHDELGWCFHDNTDNIDKYVKTALSWHQAGAKIIGGCCGTTPDYIKALAQAAQSQYQTSAA